MPEILILLSASKSSFVKCNVQWVRILEEASFPIYVLFNFSTNWLFWNHSEIQRSTAFYIECSSLRSLKETRILVSFARRTIWGTVYILITNLIHWLLFIYKILFSSTCFEPQVLIFRRIQLYTCSIWYCHSLWEFVVTCRYTAWVRTWVYIYIYLYNVIIKNLRWLFCAYVFVTEFKFSLNKFLIRCSTNFVVIYIFSFSNDFPLHTAILIVMCFNFRAFGYLVYNVKNMLCLQDTLLPVGIQWLLDTLLVAYCIAIYY